MINLPCLSGSIAATIHGPHHWMERIAHCADHFRHPGFSSSLHGLGRQETQQGSAESRSTVYPAGQGPKRPIDGGPRVKARLAPPPRNFDWAPKTVGNRQELAVAGSATWVARTVVIAMSMPPFLRGRRPGAPALHCMSIVYRGVQIDVV